MSVIGTIGPLVGVKQKVQLIQRTPNSTTAIEIDCTVMEKHSRKSPASEYPIEDGRVISDNILTRPLELELHGIISDTPIDLGTIAGSALTTAVSAITGPLGVVAGAGGVALFKALRDSGKPSVTAFAQLLALQETKQPFEVVTTLVPQSYQNMWITNLSVPRDSSTGQVLAFQLSLMQLLIVHSQTVNVKVFANPSVSASQADLANQQGVQKALKTSQDAFARGAGIVGVQ